MDHRHINFISYNSTGLDAVKIDWINDLAKTTDSTCLQIQEHFKATKSAQQCFKKHFKEFDNYAIPAIRENFSHVGRPKGVLVQLVKSNLNIKKEKVVCKSWCLQAWILHFHEYKLLWMNVYMPTDPQLQVIDETDLMEITAEIESIIATSVFNDILLGGDWNYDPRRNTRFCRFLSDFFDKNNLRSIWTKFHADYSYRHTDLKSLSLIDHFFVTKEFLDKCVDAAPLHLGDNRSSHSPIMLRINIPQINEKENNAGLTVKRPNWKKAYSEDIEAYSYKLDEKLSQLTLPSSFGCLDVSCKNIVHSLERDSHALDVLCKTIETSFECIPVSEFKPKDTKKE